MSVAALDRIRMPAGRAVALQIARREGPRLIRHPIFLSGAVISLVTFGMFTWGSAPVLHRDDVFIAGALLPVAAVTLIVANLAATRSKRHATDELYDSTITSPALRSAGHLLSLAYPVIASLPLAAVMLAWMFLASPVGMPRAAELLTGAMCVALMGTIGVALGRWTAHPALGPMAVVVLTALQLLLIQPVVGWQGTGAQAGRSPWFAPWVPTSLTGGVPPELVIRPAAWHVLFLVGLTILFAALAFAREHRGPATAGVALVGGLVLIVGAAGQTREPTPAQRAALVSLIEDPTEHQICEERAAITYCAYPAYEGWIERWAAPVEGALALIPAPERPQGLVIRQRFGTYFEGPTDLPTDSIRMLEREARRAHRQEASARVFYTGTAWGRGSILGQYEIGLSLYVAMTALDFPGSRAELAPTPAQISDFRRNVMPTLRPRDQRQAQDLLESKRRDYCYTEGQARAVAAWWIASQATPHTRASVLESSSANPFGLTIYDYQGERIAANYGSFVPIYPLIPPPMWDVVSLSGDEFFYAAELLDRLVEEVAELFHARWNDLEEPEMTTLSMLDDLGLEEHPTLEEQIAALPEDVELERGHNRWTDYNYPDGLPCG